jgi:hypothetical protein
MGDSLMERPLSPARSPVNSPLTTKRSGIVRDASLSSFMSPKNSGDPYQAINAVAISATARITNQNCLFLL